MVKPGQPVEDTGGPLDEDESERRICTSHFCTGLFIYK